MGNSASATSATGGQYDGRFFAGRRVEFSLANFRHLHAQLLEFARLPPAEIVELLRVLSEFLIYSDQHRGRDAASPSGATQDAQAAASFFDYFGEKNVLALLVELGASAPPVPVQIQLLQTLSILVQNIATRTSLYYILSNNYVNRLLECPFAVEDSDDVRDWYVTLLKALSLRLNEETVQFFFDSTTSRFPLYARALRFGRCTDNMIKVAVKTLTLNVLRVPDDRVRTFILQYEDMNYFRDIVDNANDIALKIQGHLNLWPTDSRDAAASAALIDKLEESIDEYIDHCYYLQDILDVNLPELCYKVGELLYMLHVRALLAASILPDCNPPPQRVSTRLALYLLTRLMGIFEHTPLLNAVTFMYVIGKLDKLQLDSSLNLTTMGFHGRLMSPDTVGHFEYSTVALGAGSRRQNHQNSLSKLVKSEGPEFLTDESVSPDGNIAAQESVSSPSEHAFRAHSSNKCNSWLCYLQTRFAMGEWPVEEVKSFTLEDPLSSNPFRSSLIALIQSSDERLSSAVILLVLSIINSSSVDQSLLRELGLQPYSHRRHKRHTCTIKNDESCKVSSGQDDEVNDKEDDDEDDDEEDLEDRVTTSSGSSLASPSDSFADSYPHWLVESALSVLSQNPSTRLLNAQLCVRLIVDLIYDPRAETSLRLIPEHAVKLKNLHSISSHMVMESMRGSMADVDLFVYVLEDEFDSFHSAVFPMVLNLQGSSPFEILVPAPDVLIQNSTSRKIAALLELREPANEKEMCRKSMRAFLLLRKLRYLLDETYQTDNLEHFIAYRHHHTTILSEAAGSAVPDKAFASLDGMVTLPCLWREQRFMLSPAKLLMVLNPEAAVFVEKNVLQGDQACLDDTVGVVRLFAPMHRTYCSVDGKDERVLHLTISSAVPVRGCRCDKKSKEVNGHSADRALMNWHASILFGSGEDCSQAQAHIDLCRAEVRAFKLTQIEESLSVHLEITPSVENHREFDVRLNAALAGDGKI